MGSDILERESTVFIEMWIGMLFIVQVNLFD